MKSQDSVLKDENRLITLYDWIFFFKKNITIITKTWAVSIKCAGTLQLFPQFFSIKHTLKYQIIIQDGINIQGGTFPK